ncbi:MAG: hypothetical protein M0R66_08525 [Candidatus Omnitrophica bacterium]|nr:hypothetical protein [Candidatus Omnitrophota bacterium]
MKLDDFARVVGYIVIGFWVIMVILMIVVAIAGKSESLRNGIADKIGTRRRAGGCRTADGRPCGMRR